MTSRAILVLSSGLLALGSVACVDTTAYEKTAAELDQSRRAGLYKDQKIQSLEWQLAMLGEQVREAQQRSLAQQRDLAARMQQLGEMNADLARRLKDAEGRRVPFEAADDPSAKGAAQAKPEDLRRLLAAMDARNAQLAESLARIERLLSHGAYRVGDEDARKARGISTDLVDPWGFGSRK